MPVFSAQGVRTDVSYDLACYDEAQIDAAQIPIERARGPILLLSGDDDHQWPSAVMAGELGRRMERHGRAADLTNVVYPDAGHVFAVRDFMPPTTPFDFGGSPEADASASADAWDGIARFLRPGSSLP
jgi:dienelactone hydrolase